MARVSPFLCVVMEISCKKNDLFPLRRGNNVRYVESDFKL